MQQVQKNLQWKVAFHCPPPSHSVLPFWRQMMFPYNIQFGGEILFPRGYLPKCTKKSFCLGCAKLIQLCLTLCDPMHCSPPGSFVQGILHACILEWVATPFSRGSSHPRDRSCISYSPSFAGRFFTSSATWEAPVLDS